MSSHSHPVEIVAEWGSAALLSFAAGFVTRVALAGTDERVALAASLGAALAAGVAAWAAFRLAAPGGWHLVAFEPPEIEASADGDELLLTDALAVLPDDSRVVRLFAPETLDLPGELAGRIDEWLDGARSRQRNSDGQPVTQGHGPAASPASAALHSALADIRRSLR